MSEYKLTREEIETIINFCSADKTASIYTCSSVMMRQLDKLMEQYPNDVRLIKQDKFSKTYELPKKWVMRIRVPRQISEEQKEKLRENLLKFRQEKQK